MTTGTVSSGDRVAVAVAYETPTAEEVMTQAQGRVILGIANNDDASACVVVDGTIVAAAQEERFSRIKAHKGWPTQSIEYTLRAAGKRLEDVDAIAYGWSAGFNAEQHLLLYVDRIHELSTTNPEQFRHARKRIADELRNDVASRTEFQDTIAESGFRGRVHSIDHHDAHAYGAYLCSPFEDALVVTCDGRGDYQSLTVREFVDGRETVLQRETSIDSIGYFYGRMTQLLGYLPNRHEGKVTGLAALGDPRKCMALMQRMIRVEEGRVRANCGDWYQPSYQGYSIALLQAIASNDSRDIAAATQAHTEQMLREIVKRHVDDRSSQNLCLAGGVFANVRVNQCLAELPGIKNVFVLPCMGDGGLSLAAAVGVSWKAYRVRPHLETMALGPDHDQSFTQHMILPAGITHSQPSDIQSDIIDSLMSDRVIGVIRGRMEFGPRALCRRSILYHATDTTMNDWLNVRLRRTEFMPFAPVTPENLAPLCYKGWRPEHKAPHYMTITYDCTELMRTRCPATVHVDGTARPQVICASDDPFMFNLLNRWFDMTGQPSLVNTSFNRHEEPIINTPEEAITTIEAGIVDVLYVGDRHRVSHESLRHAARVPRAMLRNAS